MAALSLFAFLLAEFCIFASFKSLAYLTREKRSLVNYNQVVRCAIDSKPIFTFSDYGCYCGGLGSGQPVDDIDRCCMNHDRCYDMLFDRLMCTRLSRYVDTYDWDCVKDDLDHDASYAPFLEAIKNVFNETGWRQQSKFPVCKGSKSYCGISLCYCDVQAALCFAKYKSPTVMAKCPDQKLGDKEAI